MAYLTKTFVRSMARDKAGTVEFAAANRQLNEHVSSVSTRQSFDIFLSHSHEDSDIILGVVEILKLLGYVTYVDWIEDRHLDRSKVTPAHADLLRKRMKQSSFLLYVTTANSVSSKWMPWELGYFDGFKPGKVGVLPILDPGVDFAGQEFIGLYPTVEYDNLPHEATRTLIWRPYGFVRRALRESVSR